MAVDDVFMTVGPCLETSCSFESKGGTPSMCAWTNNENEQAGIDWILMQGKGPHFPDSGVDMDSNTNSDEGRDIPMN